MTLNEILKKLESYHGEIATVKMERPVKVYKDAGHEVRKRSTFQVRFGVKYGNQKVVKEKHESGEIEKQGLPNGWSIVSPIAVQTSGGKILLRAAPSRNAHSVKKATWLMDGKEVEKSEVEHMLTASERKSSSQRDWVYLKPENLLELNGENFSLDG